MINETILDLVTMRNIGLTDEKEIHRLYVKSLVKFFNRKNK